jgi:hypothetical protein
MDDLTYFSLRILKTLAARIEATAKRLGVSKSEYARGWLLPNTISYAIKRKPCSRE